MHVDVAIMLSADSEQKKLNSFGNYIAPPISI
jgi:hypothetical protein